MMWLLFEFYLSTDIDNINFQQFPDLGLPRFQFGNVILVEMPGAVNAAADVVDVRGNPADSGS